MRRKYISSKSYPPMNRYSLFKQIIRESTVDNTYKMAWAKALVEIASEITVDTDEVIIPLEDIAKKYIKYYWNQTIFFDLKQGSNPLKPPIILSRVKDLISIYFELM